MRLNNKTPICGASSYAEIGEYWDKHDLSEHWDQTEPAQFEVGILSSSFYFPLEKTLAEQLRTAAEAQGVSPETLLNLWIQERAGRDRDRSDSTLSTPEHFHFTAVEPL